MRQEAIEKITKKQMMKHEMLQQYYISTKKGDMKWGKKDLQSNNTRYKISLYLIKWMSKIHRKIQI